MKKKFWGCLGISLWTAVSLGGVAEAQIQKVVVPNANAAVEGSTAASRPIQITSQTIQYVIASTQLTTITPGSFIVGLSFRLDVSATQTQSDLALNFNEYSIFVGQTNVVPNLADPTFANNYSGPRTQVRGGALNLPGGFFPFGGSPSSFGSTIGFNLNGGGYQYNGGNIIVELRHSGNPNGQFAVDAQANSPEYASFFAEGDTSTVRSGGAAAAIMQLAFSPQAILPEPGSITLLGIGALGLMTLRRARKA